MSSSQVDLSQFSKESSVRKAVYFSKDHGVLFGGLYLCTFYEVGYGFRSDPLNHSPYILRFIIQDFKDTELPAGWTQQTVWVRDETTYGAFVAHWLELPMKIDAFVENSGKIPAEVGLLLSGCLQLGEAVSSRHLDNYRRLTGLKFLPLVITPTGLRFFMYRPSSETLYAGIQRFHEVLERLGEAVRTTALELILRKMYVTVLVNQVEELTSIPIYGSETGLLRSVLQTNLDNSVCNLQVPFGSLGFVYQDLMPGPHDARRFSQDMLLKRGK